MRKQKEMEQAHPEEMLIACQKGKSCSYGICDECPNMLKFKSKEEDDE